MLNAKELELLKNGPREEKKKFAKQVQSLVENYLKLEYGRTTNTSISLTVFYHLLNQCWDYASEVMTIKRDCSELLKVLALPEVKNMESVDSFSATKTLIRIIDFCQTLEEDESQAELDLSFLEFRGESNVGRLNNLFKMYTDKIKLSEYKDLHDIQIRIEYSDKN